MFTAPRRAAKSPQYSRSASSSISSQIQPCSSAFFRMATITSTISPSVIPATVATCSFVTALPPFGQRSVPIPPIHPPQLQGFQGGLYIPRELISSAGRPSPSCIRSVDALLEMKVRRLVHGMDCLSPSSSGWLGGVVTWAGNPLDLAPPLALRNHGPTGFSWGYGDSGPARLVRAIGANIVGSSRNATIRDVRRSRLEGFVWHSQMIRTDHPFFLNWRSIAVSLFLFPSSFSRQKLTLVLGIRLPIGQLCWCQKQPWTKTIFRRRRKTRSGRPGRSRA